MREPPPDTPPPAKPTGRSERADRATARLKTALKANIARRKTQMRGRTAPDDPTTDPDTRKT